MSTKGHRHVQRGDHKEKNNPYVDLEFNEIRARMEKLAFKMQQDEKAHWVYEWPMKNKEKRLVKELLSRGQRRLMRRWLRHTENLSDTHKEMVYICEPETGRNISNEEEERSDEDIIYCQLGINGLSNW
jgi:hypothetical protein